MLLIVYGLQLFANISHHRFLINDDLSGGKFAKTFTCGGFIIVHLISYFKFITTSYFIQSHNKYHLKKLRWVLI